MLWISKKSHSKHGRTHVHVVRRYDYILPHWAIYQEKVQPPLYAREIEYRSIIQRNLKDYFKIWQLIEKIWQIKPKDFSYMDLWKSDQENEMLKIKGNALVDNQLTNFLRMLNCSIPQESFNEINSKYMILLNKNRELVSVSLNI